MLHRSQRAALAAAVWVLATGGWAAEDPSWRLPGYDRRAAFRAPAAGGHHVAVTVPVLPTAPPPSSMAALDPSGKPLPVTLVHAGPGGATAVVDLGYGHPEGWFELYYGADTNGGENAAASDPTPVSLDLRLIAGRSPPTSTERLFFLYEAARAAAYAFDRLGFDEFPVMEHFVAEEVKRLGGKTDLTPAQQEQILKNARHRYAASHWLARLQTALLVPEAGVYRFALGADDLGMIAVDGGVVLEAYERYDPGGRRIGEATFLEAGVHRLVVFVHAGRTLSMDVGWITPGQDDVRELPADLLLAGGVVENPRLDRIDEPAHTHAAFEFEQAYGFRGSETLFIPVTLTHETTPWDAETMRAEWLFPGGGHAEGDRVRHVLQGRGTHALGLRVSGAGGELDAADLALDTRCVVPLEYEVGARVQSLPAVCYPHDLVEPVLRVGGRLPPDCGDVLAQVTVVATDGQEHALSRPVRFAPHRPALVRLARAWAGDLREIRWRVEHEGVELASGRVAFEHAPFTVTPVRAEADALFDAGGRRIVLVPATRRGLYTPAGGDRPAAVTWIDDMLVPTDGGDADRLATELDMALKALGCGATVSGRRLPPQPAAPHALEALLKLVEIPRELEGHDGTVVLSVGGADLRLQGPGAFERHAAALADIVAGAMGRRVVLLTPPPDPAAPDATRAYAVALRRVADARGLEVADLYTAFRGVREPGPPLLMGEGTVLSAAGRDLAAAVVARAVAGAGGDASP